MNLLSWVWTRHGMNQSRILGMRTRWSYQQLRWTVSTVTMTETWPWAERRTTHKCSRSIEDTEVISTATSRTVHVSHVVNHECSQCQVRTPDPAGTQIVITSYQTTYSENHVQNNEVSTPRQANQNLGSTRTRAARYEVTTSRYENSTVNSVRATFTRKRGHEKTSGWSYMRVRDYVKNVRNREESLWNLYH